jgi:hypothetical protein
LALSILNLVPTDLLVFLDLLESIKTLDKRPAAVHHHNKEEHHARISGKLKHVDDSHSLQGKHGKTHGIC